MMTRRMTRRRFIQLGGLAGTAVAVSGCTINLQKYETLEPYVVPPEEALPGEYVWYASTCSQCPAGCGIVVQTGNGRAKFIAGNPQHPLNQNRLCARGQAGLQVLYNPDRLRNAVRQTQRGTGDFHSVSWDQILPEIADRVKAARPGGVAYYGNLHTDSLASIAGKFLSALNSPPPVTFDPLTAMEGHRLLADLMRQFYATPGPSLPFFDLAQSDVVFSFGADFSETWLSPVAYGRSYGQMRGGALGKRGYLVQFEPRMSAAGAVADRWIPIAPGTEGLVALALGSIIASQGLGAAKNSPYAGLFANVDVEGIAAASGIPVKTLDELAQTFGAYDRPTAIPGGAMSGHTNAPAAMTAVIALNALLGRAGGPGSAFLLTLPPPTDAFVATNPSSFADVGKLIGRMNGGEVDVLFVHGNPQYELPIASGFAQALATVPFVVSFSWIVDETAMQSDVILPADSYLESWGYRMVTPPGDRPTLSGQQPVVSRQYDTRATTDVFLGLADLLGGAVKQALPWNNTVEFMKAATATLVGQSAPYSTKNADEVWAGWRQYGGWWPTVAPPEVPASPPKLPSSLEVPRPGFEGEGGELPYLLYPYPSVALTDGRGANQPWLQETPDPMTTASWETWVEIHPDTAARIGVKTQDKVKVISSHGEVVTTVYVYPGIEPDVVAVPLGQGHSANGRYAASRGANVLAILTSQTSEAGDWAWAATRVRLERLEGQTQVLPRIENNVGVDFARGQNRFPA
jgi:anaerobic selenocysteine-containing dehydrogenase